MTFPARPAILLAVFALTFTLTQRLAAAEEETNLLPSVPPGFVPELFARDPLVRHPVSLCFDSRGRMFVGGGPQFRSPKPDTRGDSVLIVTDEDGDGVADTTKTFATGFNCIQSLTWKGKDLWVANAPDFTVVRDLDGDDEADEYVLIWTDMGNLEHGLHGLNWGPDGKLYMTKGNSKGYSKDRFAPRPFRTMWDAPYPADAPDYPPIQVFTKDTYKKSYHNPSDDWGRTGGVFRCDDMGANPEIISLGLRNPWDMAFDEGFNAIGSDNDQDGGDKIFMPFFGAHFGWGHPWSYDWRGVNHPPTVKASGPYQIGSATGTKFYAGSRFPEAYRNVYFLNDWQRKVTFVHRPKWEGALLQSDREEMEIFASPEDGSVYAPSDLEIGPDGALYINGWDRGYGVQWKDGVHNGEMTSQGRIFRIRHKDFPLRPRSEWDTAKRRKPYSNWTFAELIEDFGPESLPVWRVDAQEELVRRDAAVRGDLLTALNAGSNPMGVETYLAWTLGRIQPKDDSIDRLFGENVTSSDASLNLRIQSLRILAHRVRNFKPGARLPASVAEALKDPEPRIRFDAVQAIWQADQTQFTAALAASTAKETDEITFYSAWNALRHLGTVAERKELLKSEEANVRFATLMSFLGTPEIAYDELIAIVEDDPDPRMQEWALRWVLTGAPGRIKERRPSRQRGLNDVMAVTKMVRGSVDKPIRRFLIDLLPKVERINDEGWQDLQQLHNELKEQTAHPLTREERIAFIGAFAHHQNSMGLLWEELRNEDDALQEAAVNAFVELRNPGRDFLSDRMNPGDDLRRQKAIIESLSRFDHERQSWTPRGHSIRALGQLSDATNDPSLRAKILALVLSMDWALVEVARELTEAAADDADPRVYNLAAPLAAKLGAAIELGEKPQAATAPEVLALVDGADPKNGEKLFHDKTRSNCASCHQVDGIGAQFAPPLSDVGIRMTRELIVESILLPSAKITEGYHVSTILTKDGKALLGVIRKETDTKLELFLADARSLELDTANIQLRQATTQSIMPGNMGEILGAKEIADLVAWLQTRKTPPKDPQATK